jgi:hypothetical protein
MQGFAMFNSFVVSNLRDGCRYRSSPSGGEMRRVPFGAGGLSDAKWMRLR